MKDAASKAAANEGAAPPDPEVRRFQELWFALARRNWRSIVFLPADPAFSAEGLARSLADVGNRVSDMPVTAVTVSALEYGSALALAELQQHVARAQPDEAVRTPLIDVTARVVSTKRADDAPADAVPVGAIVRAPSARLVIAIPSVVAEPLGLAAAHEADAVVIAVELGRTRKSDVQRTIELVGRDRIAGCLLVS